MAAQGNYASVPRNGGVTISTANANRDGTGTLGTVMTGATRNTSANPPLTGGSRIDGLAFAARGTTTAGMIRLFIHDGTSNRLFAEIPVQAVTPSATVAAWSARATPETADFMPIVLGDGQTLKASTEKAESFDVIPFRAGDF